MAECSVGLLTILPSDVLDLMSLQHLDLVSVCKLSLTCAELYAIAQRVAACKIAALPRRPYLTLRGSTCWLHGPFPAQTSHVREGSLVARRRQRR